MGVRWDSVLARATARELHQRLAGARSRAYRLDRASRTVWIFFDEGTLELGLGPDGCGVRLHDPVPPHEGATRLNGTLVSADAPPDERRIELSVLLRRGATRRLVLVLELAPNRANALWIDERERRVRDGLPYRGPGTGSVTEGAVYPEPPPPTRVGLDGDLAEEVWREHAEDPRSLVRSVAWTSPLNAAPLLRDGEDGYTLWQTIAEGTTLAPCVLSLGSGPQPYPHALPGVAGSPQPDLLAAFSACAGEASPPTDPGLLRRLEHAETQIERELSGLRRELGRQADPDALRSEGDLLLARLASLRRGQREVELEAFDGSRVTLPLDPTLEPHENANRRYRRAAKAERARQVIPERIEALEARLKRLAAAKEGLHRGKAPPAELLPPTTATATGGATRGEDPAILPYRTFRSSGGLEIRVGRGARHNDDLTFRHSRPNDVWMHARDVSGAHVILRWDAEGPPPARDLEEAATLAALRSRARTSGWVPVDWTRRKWVRKPRGAAPGAVVPDRVKTVFVEPDPDLPDRLDPERL